MLNNKWLIFFNDIKFKFKPIVNIHTGATSGIEILNIYSKSNLFDEAFNDGILFQLELRILREKLKIFKNLKDYKNINFFLSFDVRIFSLNDFNVKDIFKIINSFDMNLSNIYFNFPNLNCKNSDIYNFIFLFKHYGIKIGIDNFGNGVSDLKLLYDLEADFIRIDEFFINQIDKDFKKKLIVSNLINLAHILGVKVLAKNIQTKKEFLLIKDLNFDFIEGNLITKEVDNILELKENYEIIRELNVNNLRKKENLTDKKLIKNEIEKILPISIESPIVEVFNSFKKNSDRTFLPVIDLNYEPIGVIREKDLKEYVYSFYGKDLLLNKSIGKSLMDFTSKCSILDINTDIEEILEIFCNDYSSEGIIITKNTKYLGFLSAKALVKILNEKNLNIARNQNPLTKLAGNNLITEFIEKVFKNRENTILVYFDFDNFKPYNDKYGFRQGDRMILLFSELMQKEFAKYRSFLGHIGGDDFFIGIKGVKFEDGLSAIINLIEKFTSSARDFYSPEDRENNFVILKDREGNIKKFPLLSASAVVVYIRESSLKCSIEEVSEIIAKLKKPSKNSPTKLALASII